MKPAIIVRRIGPYHAARLEALNRRLDGNLTVIEICRRDSTYQWTPVRLSLCRETLFCDEADGRATGDLWSRMDTILTASEPSVVAVPGWSDAGALAALSWCQRFGVPTVLMSDSTEFDEKRSPWREAVKRTIVKMAGSGFVAGKPQRAYLETLGMASDKIVTGYDVVDNLHFSTRAERARSDAGQRPLAPPASRPHFLTCCRMVEKKNLFRLVDAFELYRRRSGPAGWGLAMVGDGPLRQSIERHVRDKELASDVTFHGFVQYDALPRVYRAAAAFILASTSDQWGLVVNEAMASGLPVLVSTRCGCAADLVRHGYNGVTFDPFDIEDMARCMFEIAHGATDREALGANSRRVIADWTPETFAQRFIDAARTAESGATGRRSRTNPLLLRCIAEARSLVPAG